MKPLNLLAASAAGLLIFSSSSCTTNRQERAVMVEGSEPPTSYAEYQGEKYMCVTRMFTTTIAISAHKGPLPENRLTIKLHPLFQHFCGVG